jgi:DNA-binding ferritin-like protein
MLDIIYLLVAIQIFAKDAHYNFRGVDFKPLHEWMDEIADPIGEYVDDIKEQVLLRKGIAVPRGTIINHEAAFYVPSDMGENNKQILSNLHALLSWHTSQSIRLMVKRRVMVICWVGLIPIFKSISVC